MIFEVLGLCSDDSAKLIATIGDLKSIGLQETLHWMFQARV